MIEADVNPHQGNRETGILVNYSINETIKSDARVKLYLNQWDPVDNGFDYNIDYTLRDYFAVDPGNLSPLNIKLTSIPSGFYRICMRLAHNGSYYRDCDSGNQFLLIDDTPINSVVQEDPLPIKLEVFVPEQVFVGEEFVINASIINDGVLSKEVKVYSYVHNGSKRVSEGVWDSNAENLTLSPGSIASVSLRNEVRVLGDYSLTVKAVHESSISVRRDLKVVQHVEDNISLNEIRDIDDMLRIVVSNPTMEAHDLCLRVYSPDYVYEQNFTLSPKRSSEDFFNLTNWLIVFLYSGNYLIDEKVYVDNSSPINNSPVTINESFVVNNTFNTISGLLNNSPSYVNESYQAITGNAFIEPVFSMETLLYSFIVMISLTVMSVLLWKV